ncbi:MAG TPA: response regulator [Anaerolineales bacterium]|nr:response regulator [Anaerolineales bacterium]
MTDNDKIRVLIVDDIPETRENIRKVLQFENDVEVVAVGRTGKEGIDLARETRPDVVLMDINMPDMDGISATEMIRRANPFSQIVILSVQNDPNYMRRAMLAGARDFLAKPPSVDELTSAIRRAGRMAHDERVKVSIQRQPSSGGPVALSTAGLGMGKVIVVYSPKGGTGCTTLAVNLSIVLHNEETPVILVDGNLQFGDVAVFLNEQGKYSVADLAPRADELDPDVVDEVTVLHSLSKIRILPGPSRPEYAENVTGDQFAKVLNYLRKMYSYIVVDTSSTLTDAVLAAIDIADLIVLLTTQDIPAIKNARLFLDLADILKIDRRRILFTMNRYDKRIGITAEKVGESFKHEVTAMLPFEERVVIPSINRGRPFVMDDKSKPVARAVLSLAEIVRTRIKEFSQSEQVQEQVSGMKMSRFGRR